MITITINNEPVNVPDGSTVAAAIIAGGTTQFRRSAGGKARGALCGMGICFECRVMIDGVPLRRSCVTLAADGMEVTTDE